MPKIRVPPILRPAVGGESEIVIEGNTLETVLGNLTEQHPAITQQLFDQDNNLNRYLNIYLNDEDIRMLDGLQTAVSDADRIVILPAMAGGSINEIKGNSDLRKQLSGIFSSDQLPAETGSILNTIGNTPLVELKRITPKSTVKIWAKLECQNPTGSIKDRVALSMILDAESNGRLIPGQTILEPTSGNTGISLAFISKIKGYPLKVVMPENVTPERVQILQGFGAEIVFSDAEKGSNGAVELAQRIADGNTSVFMPHQYANQANPQAHYFGTAAEILNQLEDIDAFVAGLGTGGTLMGVGRRMRETFGPNIKIVAAEPMPGEMVQGLRSLDDGYVPPILDVAMLDRKMLVDSRQAITWTKRLLSEEGIFAGVSSGAIVSVAVRIANELEQGNVVCVIPDDGWRYLSSGIYSQPVEAVEGMESTVWW